MGVEDLLERFHQILEQVKPIGDLGGLGRSLARTVGLGFGPVARDDLHPRVRPQPLGQGLCLAVGQQGDRLAALEIDQPRAIRLAFAQGEIVDTQDGGGSARRDRQPAEQAQQRVPAHGDVELLAQPHASSPAQRPGQRRQACRQPCRPPGPGGGHIRQALRADLTGARRVVTEKLPYAELPRDTPSPSGQIRQRTLVAAVDTLGHPCALRTWHPGRRRSDMQHDLGRPVIDVPRLKA